LDRCFADECADEDPELIPFMGTAQTVNDLDRIREALGDERLSYVGYSYGTLIGELYAERFPERVRAMVLDGVVDPALDLEGTARGQAAGIERALGQILAACGAGCPLDDAAATYDTVAAELESAGGDGPAQLQLAAVYATYDPGIWPEFHEALADAAEGDYETLEALAQGYIGIGPFSPYVAILCMDLPAPDDFEAFAQLAGDIGTSAPRLGGAVGFELLPCAYWSAPPSRDPAPVQAEGAPPILVVGNTGDAATPYEQAERVADSLESGVLLTLDAEGHVGTGDPCVDGIIGQYLVELAVPPEGTTC
jgi:pimeloyl-ACP methyl ester carboxylesterase